MNSFTSLLAIFVAAFVLVNCDKDDQVRVLMKKIIGVYEKLSLNETRARVEGNLKYIENDMTATATTLEKEDLVVVAKWYRTIVAWIVEGMPKASAIMDKMQGKERFYNWMGMGIAVELITDLAQMKPNGTKVAVNETEVSAQKNFENRKTRVLHLTKAVADGFKKKADKQFWADLHQNVYELLVRLFKDVDTGLKSVKTTELRTKTYEKLTAYLEGLLKATEFRAKPPQTFFGKVGHKIKELADKISSFF